MKKIIALTFIFCIVLNAQAQKNKKNISPKTDSIYNLVQEKPIFQGCEDLPNLEDRNTCSESQMMNFVLSQIVYPDTARKQGIEGMVVISFVVEKTGDISNAMIAKDIGGGCGEEALRVVGLLPKWIPAKKNGELVRFRFNLPVRYKFEDNVYELPTFEKLQMIFCKDFTGEFFKAEDINSWSEGPYNKEDLCTFGTQVENLIVKYDDGEKETAYESEGELTRSMRDVFKNAKAGSSIHLEISISHEGNKGKIIKVLMIE